MGRPNKVDREDREVVLLLNGSYRLGIEVGLDIPQMVKEGCDMSAYKWFHDHKRKVRAAGLETKVMFVENENGDIEIKNGK